ncbi:MAG: hemerythrin domain-containing protein [Acidobacteriota bacterium]
MTTPTPSRLLAELQHQHEKLRAMMDRCEQLADDLDRGGAQASELTREVAKLRLAFDAHNRFEEQLLRPVLRDLDAFGTVRLEQMVADHVEEHRAMRQQLDGPTGELRATLYELRAHLAAEERYFLSSHVLRDDLVTVEGGG